MGAITAVLFIKYMETTHPMMMWVDDTITILARGEDLPTEGVLVDRRTYVQGVLRVSVPDKKVQYSSTGDWRTLLSAAPEVVDVYVGHSWVTNPVALGRTPASPCPPFHGTDFYLQERSVTLVNMSTIRWEIWGQMKPQHGPACGDDGPRGQGTHKTLHCGQRLLSCGHNLGVATVQHTNDALRVRC